MYLHKSTKTHARTKRLASSFAGWSYSKSRSLQTMDSRARPSGSWFFGFSNRSRHKTQNTKHKCKQYTYTFMAISMIDRLECVRECLDKDTYTQCGYSEGGEQQCTTMSFCHSDRAWWINDAPHTSFNDFALVLPFLPVGFWYERWKKVH